MNKIYHIALGEALNYSDQDAFVSDMALSSIWEDEAEEIPVDRVEWLRQVWRAAHRTVKEICKDAGFTQGRLAEYFGIPARTVGNWCTGVNACPDYTRIMIQELLGLVSRDFTQYNLIYSIRGSEEVVFRGTYSETLKAESTLRSVLRINDPDGTESDCYLRTDAELAKTERSKDLWNTLTDEEKHDYIEVDGRRYVRKIWEAQNK